MTEKRILIVVEGRDQASSAFHGVGGALGGIGQIAAGILTAGLFQRIADGIFGMGRQALDSIANYERMGMSLQTLAAREALNTGQATDMAGALALTSEKGKELLDWTQKLAIKSPFSQQGISDAFRTAMAYGFTTDESKRLTGAMVDFAAGTGASSESMNRIALALGQIKAKGKLAGGEVLQLVNAGLPVTQILAKAFNVTTAELMDMQKDGLIPADKAIEAITQSLEHDFAGAAERQASSWAGLMGTFEDLKQIGLREFFGGIATAAQPFMNQLSEWIQGDGLIKLKEWGSALGDIAGKFFGIASAVLEAGPLSVEVIDMLGLSTEKGKALFAGLGVAVEYVRGIIAQFAPALMGLWAFWVNNGPALSETVGNTFGKLAEIGKNLLDQIIPFLAEKLAVIAAWFNSNAPLIRAFAEVVGAALVAIGERIAGLWAVVAPLIGGIIDLVLGLAKTIMQLATGDWAGAWETIKQTVANAAMAIWNAVIALGQWIWTGIQQMWATVGPLWSQLWEGVKKTVSDAWAAIVQYFRDAWTRMADAAAYLLNGLIDMAKGYLSRFVDMGRNLVDGIIDGIRNAAGGVVDALKDVVNSAIEAAKAALGIQSPSKVFAGIGDNMMKGLAKGVGGGVNVPLNAVASAMNSVTTGAAAASGGSGALGGGSGGSVNIQFVYSPVMSMADEYEFTNRIAPAIDKLLRERGY